MADLQKRGSYTPRRAREQRAYRLVVTGGVAGAVGVVTLVLAFIGVLGPTIPVIALIVAVICAVHVPAHRIEPLSAPGRACAANRAQRWANRRSASRASAANTTVSTARCSNGPPDRGLGPAERVADRLQRGLEREHERDRVEHGLQTPPETALAGTSATNAIGSDSRNAISEAVLTSRANPPIATPSAPNASPPKRERQHPQRKPRPFQVHEQRHEHRHRQRHQPGARGRQRRPSPTADPSGDTRPRTSRE